MALKVTPMPPPMELCGLEQPLASVSMSRGYVLLSSINVREAKGDYATCSKSVSARDYLRNEKPQSIYTPTMIMSTYRKANLGMIALTFFFLYQQLR